MVASDFKRRLAAIEHEVIEARPRAEVWIVNGGFPGEPRFARSGHRRWARLPDEDLADFAARVERLATEAGAPFAVISNEPPPVGV